jgi:hypothetical protein
MDFSGRRISPKRAPLCSSFQAHTENFAEKSQILRKKLLLLSRSRTVYMTGPLFDVCRIFASFIRKSA